MGPTIFESGIYAVISLQERIKEHVPVFSGERIEMNMLKKNVAGSTNYISEHYHSKTPFPIGRILPFTNSGQLPEYPVKEGNREQ
jgi:hypothetical protein